MKVNGDVDATKERKACDWWHPTCYIVYNINNIIGSVHKYFGGGGGGLGNWKFLSSNFFDPPSQASKTFWTPPSTSVKTFLTPPHCYMYNISVFPQHQFIWYAPQVYQYYW